MASIARGQTSDCSNPILDVFFQVQGITTDVAVLEYVISEKVTNPGVPTQVFPASGRAVADVSALCPTGHKLTTGRYVAEFTPEVDAPIGTWQIDWFFKLTNASNEQTFKEEFEVLPEVTASTASGYCTVQSLRDEGVPARFTDAVLQAKIAKWSQYIENVTGRWFEPRSLQIKVDGKGSQELLLEIPIISITDVTFDTSPFSPDVLEVTADNFRVYNRHLTQRLTNPDDRDNPKVEFINIPDNVIEAQGIFGLTNMFFPIGVQNVNVNGVFGYTDYDGSPYGKTPDMICEACKLLVLRDLEPRYSGRDKAFDARNQGRLKRMKTRDQEIEWHDTFRMGTGTAYAGAFTGDPEIDSILAMYMRPPHFGAA